MTELLYKEPVFAFSKAVASTIGLNEAIILQKIHLLTKQNEDAKRNCINGRYWVRLTYKDLEKEFPFWCNSTIRNTIKKLEKSGIIISQKHNEVPSDQTKWYSVDYEKFYLYMEEQNT